tara:strand:+ start:134 stop:781 length:648 start_codon:yes stop_codon:yes gene_type:complete
MSEEVKVAEPVAEAVAAPEPKPEAPNVDYAAEMKKISDAKAAKERELAQAQHTIVELKRKKDAEQPDIAAMLDERLEAIRNESRAEIERAKSELAGDIVAEEISRMSADPTAQELIAHHYQNSIQRSGMTRSQVRDDVRKAFTLAHGPIVEKLASEVAHANGARAATQTGYASGQPSNRDDLSQDDEAEIAKIARMVPGASIESIRKTYLSNKSN